MKMTKKKIQLEDGRYLVYFGFPESKKSSGSQDTDAAKTCCCRSKNDGKSGCCGGKE